MRLHHPHQVLGASARRQASASTGVTTRSPPVLLPATHGVPWPAPAPCSSGSLIIAHATANVPPEAAATQQPQPGATARRAKPRRPKAKQPAASASVTSPPSPQRDDAAVFRTLGSVDNPVIDELVDDPLATSLDSLDGGPPAATATPARTAAPAAFSGVGVPDEQLQQAEENPYTPADAESAPTVPDAVGEAELERLLAEGGQDLSVDRVCQVFPYPLDNFQKKSLEVFLSGRSVVVCAPTGAGKTAIAEAAAAAVLARGQRVIYTTPLKALSNQKLFEMRKRFGHARVGLQTGDTSLNTEAQIVIMTTEILRNIMYRTAELSDPDPTSSSEHGGEEEGGQGALGQVEGEGGASLSASTAEGEYWEDVQGGGAAWEAAEGFELDAAGAGAAGGVGASRMTREARLGDVGLVVMDEVHYLGDPSRGSVWEEAIINCPRHIQLLCMSATVKNPGDLGAWISKEHMPCTTIKTSFRPVPLQWMHAYTAPPPRGLQLLDLLSKDGRALNPRLDSKAIMVEEARAMVQRQQRSLDPFMSFGSGGGLDGGDALSLWDNRSLASMMEGDLNMQRKARLKRVPNTETLILRLKKQNMLPAIWFILSRKDCDLSAVRAASGTLMITTDEEQAAIREELEALQADQPEAVRETLVPALIKGVASHHAGHLPGWKSLVERLFQRGLLKVVFATGTLAAGINMPARTTVISALSRRTDDGHQLLPHNELLQMAGRAGRRGYDVVGYCVVLQTKFENPQDAFSIIKAGPEPLVSHFTVSYGLVLNLLSIYSLEQARQFCNRSFGVYQRQEGNARRQKEVQELEARISAINNEFAATASTTTKALTAAVKTAKEQLRSAREEVESDRSRQAEEALQRLGLPRKVVLSLVADRKGGKGVRSFNLPAVLTSRTEDDEHPGKVLYEGLGADNRLVRVSPVHVSGWLDGSAPEEGSLGAQAADEVRSALGKATVWGLLSERVTTARVAPGNSATATVALQLQPKVEWHVLSVNRELSRKVSMAKEALSKAQTDLAAHQLRESIAANDAAGRGGWNRGPSGGGGGAEEDEGRLPRQDRGPMDKLGLARSLQRRVDKLKEEIRAAEGDTWRNFQDVVTVLGQMDAIEGTSLKLHPLGMVARNIQGQNELWLALVLTHPVMIGLTGPELAGVLGAILCGEVVRKPGEIAAAYTASQRVVDAVNALEGRRQKLSELQAAVGLGAWNETLLVDLRLAGIVEAWAAGLMWKQVVADSGMDDGDIARLLIRTADLLKQISWQKDLLPHLSEACIEALQGMERKPIAETLI